MVNPLGLELEAVRAASEALACEALAKARARAEAVEEIAAEAYAKAKARAY